MKALFASLPAVILVMLIGAPAMANDIDFSQVKCGEFVAASKDDAVLLLTWLEGYFADKNNTSVLRSEKAAQDGKNIHDYCVAHGDIDVINAAKAVAFGK